MSADLIDTTEMYLKTILELEEDGIVPLRARIVERLGHSGPTVSQTVARMERDGLVTVRADRQLELTPVGRTQARHVLRKHRLAERLLVDVIGMDWVDAHDEACRWEHVMSAKVEEQLVRLLGDPTIDPYGNPVPGLGRGVRGEESAEVVVSRYNGPVEVTVSRIGEPIQAEAILLGQLDRTQIRPGSRVVLRDRGGALDVIAVRVGTGEEEGILPGQPVSLPRTFVPHFFVVADIPGL
ncbi:metal-dependent transcriptional regulator [Actinomyces minihominis]|uniref:metal-dependent transcriptional regulator n=1 Tax=Actinomyces minihominis TaxID=2002838 RepID=UPI002413DA35|nr:metal-dependent transcriptional regulator [Actinomyces minihominis]